MILSSLAALTILMFTGSARAEDLAPRAVKTRDGATRICWNPPSVVHVDARVRISDAAGVEVRARPQAVCAAVQGPGPWSLALADGPAEPVEEQPWRWVGPPREPALLPTTTQQVAMGPDGALWFARCRDGLTRLDPTRQTRRTWTWRDGLPKGCFTGVQVDDRGVAHGITPEDVATVDPRSQRVSSRPFDVSASVASLYIARDGTVWVGGQGGRLRGLHPDGQRTRFDGMHLGGPGTIEQISESPGGDLWLSSWSRLTRLNPTARSFEMRVPHSTPPELPVGRPGQVVFAKGQPWVVVLPGRVRSPDGELEHGGRAGLVHLLDDRYVRAEAPGLPEQPTSVTVTKDGALWLTDERGIVRFVPALAEARRLAVRRGHVPGGPWLVADGDTVWAATTGMEQGPVLTHLAPDGAVLSELGPTPLPSTGVLVRADDAVVLATHDRLWRLVPDQAQWIEVHSFGDVLTHLGPGRLRSLHTGPSGRTWAASDDGLHVREAGGHWHDVALPGTQRPVLDVWETPSGQTVIATSDDLLWFDRAGTHLRVVDERDRAVTGVRRLTIDPGGAMWAWGSGGAWIVAGSDAVKQLGGPVHDLVFDEDGAVWAVGAYGVRRRALGATSFSKVPIPRGVVGPRQVAVRDGELEWIRARDGLWRRHGDRFSLTVPGDGEVFSAGDGTLWRWDPDGLHVLPKGAVAFRWAGLPARARGTGPSPLAPIAADAITVRALSGVLAVQIGDVVVGDPRRRDPIVHLDVRGVRWAALSRRGVLLRGEGYRILERVYVPGPARRVAVGPRGVCVAGSAVWCKDGPRWREVIGVDDQPAALPAVALSIDEHGVAWSLHPGALCRQGRGCRAIRGASQTSLVPDGDGAWVGSLQGLYRVDPDGRSTLVRPGAAVLDLERGEGDEIWLALEGEGVVRWTEQLQVSVGAALDPRIGVSSGGTVQIARERTGRVWLRQADAAFVLEPGWAPPPAPVEQEPVEGQ